jgi:Uma2 family endonuclease
VSALPAEKRVWTPEEYLAWEREAPEKHEYFQGEMFAMAGAKRRHNLLSLNFGAELRDALRRRPCEVYVSDMRVKVPATGLYSYPDAVVVCGTPQFEDGEEDTLLNPVVLVEVLSKSTSSYDRGEKFESYRTIPSFKEYVLVSQAKVLVEHFARQTDGSWLMREHRAGERVMLASIDTAIAVDEIYLKAFDSPSEDEEAAS